MGVASSLLKYMLDFAIKKDIKVASAVVFYDNIPFTKDA